ncbi:MAG: hypothetical protein COZ57_03650 [Armatimonadetes bacterium CG_4_8_14_3_um_filter_66_20]|nr:MAG: hypothetical protein COZ57_03650 [Armatimonadetes bacterium CG_4_8_14_3_um_filter_66_20]
MSSVGELWAREFIREPVRGPLPRKARNRLAKSVGADSFFYLPIEAIPRCLDLDEKDLCMACLTAKYPTPHGNRMYLAALDLYRKGVQGRAHEVAR